MIGHYLLTLTPEQEERVLTSRLFPGQLVRKNGERCLLGVCEDWEAVLQDDDSWYDIVPGVRRLRLISWELDPGEDEERWLSVPWRFDLLCKRFGTERVNRAIRNRILSNQARRALQQATQVVGV